MIRSAVSEALSPHASSSAAMVTPAVASLMLSKGKSASPTTVKVSGGMATGSSMHDARTVISSPTARSMRRSMLALRTSSRGPSGWRPSRIAHGCSPPPPIPWKET